MNLIVPMAGRGKRLRPHTLHVPKPLLPVAGKPIVQRLVEDIAAICREPIEEIAFVIGDFGAEVERSLAEIAQAVGAKPRIFYQEEPLGTAHAVLCARECLGGEVLIAFADTLFRADFQLDRSKDGAIWVNYVEDPRPFGVVTLDDKGHITAMVEKPQEFVSDLAIIGIYYLKDGKWLEREMQYLLDNNLKHKGEYQLTDALDRMIKQGAVLEAGRVNEWLDCGNKEAVLDTNLRVLTYDDKAAVIDPTAAITDSVIIQPCYIGPGVVITRSVVGPHCSIGAHSKVEAAVLENVILHTNTSVAHISLKDTMVGQDATVTRQAQCLNVGAFSAA